MEDRPLIFISLFYKITWLAANDIKFYLILFLVAHFPPPPIFMLNSVRESVHPCYAP